MTSTASENNKRIAKNTMFLYFRSILTMGVGLYTSREVLAQLGVEDYGINNVVGGVIVLFSFIQGAMSSATSRFFTFDLGRGDFDKLNKTFSLSLIIHIATALVILILGETVGLWFLNNKLVIPPERMGAANFVYQFSVIGACIGIIQIPYMVAVTAHERMKVFAYAGLADAGFKLAIAISLGFVPFDKLKTLSMLGFSVFIIMTTFYRIYCHRNFPETRFKWFWDKKMFVERMTFSGWTTLNGMSAIAALQGANMLLNVFHGIVANAAYGVMTSVNNAITQFTNNLMAAFNPQTVKSYARSDFDYLHGLIFRFSRISFILLSLFIVPIVLNMDFVLNLWLKDVPVFAVVFCQIRLTDHLFAYTFSGLLASSINATGKIKYFIIADSILVLMNFVLCYIFFKLGYSPIVVPIVYFATNLARLVPIYIFAKRLIHFPFRKFCKNIITCQFVIAAICFPLPIYLHVSISGNAALSFLVSTAAFLLLFLPTAYLIGLERNEKTFLKNKILNFTKK